MKKIFLFLMVLLAVSGCSKHDPILPGVRYDIFDSNENEIVNRDVPELSGVVKNIYGDENCDYRQDENNTIWAGDKKIYSGFAPDSVVKSNQKPMCLDGFVYTGLSTGEVIKLNPKNGRVAWVADVFRANNLTGGASIVDIVARVGADGKYVYAGGLGDAFCKLKLNDGDIVWCVNISVPVDFIIVDDFAFVVGGDNKLYAININNGFIYWATEIKRQIKPVYNGKNITVGKQAINYKTGELIK